MLVLWVFFFRLVHYLLFLKASLPFLAKETSPVKVVNTIAKTDSGDLVVLSAISVIYFFSGGGELPSKVDLL